MVAGKNGLRFPWSEPPAEGAAIEVADGVLWMRMPLPMVLDHVNIYALADEDGWTIVDTGFNSKRGRAIWEKLLVGPLAGRPVRRVLITHHHPDHVGLAGWLQNRTGATLLATRTAWLMARMLCLDDQACPAPETLRFWRRAGMDPTILAKRAVERPFNFADVVWPIPLGFQRIKQDDVLHLAGRDWVVHIGNGHAPEHATLWSQSDNLVLAGDQVLSSISPNIGVYATEPQADPVGEWLEACNRFVGLANAAHLVLGGHKMPFTGLPLRLRQLIDNHHGALVRLCDVLDQPKAATECFMVLFKRKIGDAEYGLALVEAYAHLSHLYQHGHLSREIREDGAYVYRRIA